MRIAHIAFSAGSKRSNRYAAHWRIHSALQNAKHDSFTLAHSGLAEHDVKLFSKLGVINSLKKRIIAKLDTVPIRIFTNRRTDLPLSAGWIGYNISSRVNEEKPEIVNLHWITSGCVNLQDLHRISCPIVLTLHDTWAVTGCCHCNLGCDKWKDGCFNCPQLSGKILGFQISHILWLWKRYAYTKISNLVVVTPSSWLGNIVRESPLFVDRRVEVIPNCLNLEIFKPGLKEKVRNELGLPQDCLLLAFGAVNATNTIYKGYHLLIEALECLTKYSKKSYHLVIFGANGDGRALPYPATFLGNLHSEFSVAKVYQAADVFVTPSQQDNFPNTVLESIACGLPVVGFNVGGIPEIIKHKEQGYIAQAFDPNDFARGIAWVTRSPESILELGSKARNFALSNYAPEIIARKYTNLYLDILSKNKKI